MTPEEKNRRDMPNVAELVDELRAAGLTFRVLAAEDFVTGKKVGTFDEEREEDD